MRLSKTFSVSRPQTWPLVVKGLNMLANQTKQLNKREKAYTYVDKMTDSGHNAGIALVLLQKKNACQRHNNFDVTLFATSKSENLSSKVCRSVHLNFNVFTIAF